ncbi:unnamed protein product [Bursaphelenchus xylophilus]|uniref:(pine wood nematode) hypothetical protein n=1 Tax=Bursaphelenchus xylophilus TaxID=6326 RepID=A0A1I7S8I9_BURXY|nr:unnamed protein product [Bursaphelenchus xylophilus]CAG9121121.1 unnamed protein product [Bursaphelenchus xylophilus]
MTLNLEQYRLTADDELRFEVGGVEILLELIEGDVEIFGTPLIRFKKYPFPPGFRGACYAFKSATVEIAGPLESVYTAHAAVPMVPYRNVHAGLKTRRLRVAPDQLGPKVMVAGPKDVGKSTLCKLLGNYAVRSGSQVLYVDLDPGQNIVFPGCVSCINVEKLSHPLYGFDTDRPYVMNYGSLNPLANQKLYDIMVEHLAEVVQKKMRMVERFKKGGVIIDTTAFSKGNYYKSIVKAAEVFNVDLLIVLDHERLFADLQRDLKNKSIKIIHLPKSGGVETRTAAQETEYRRNIIQKYFYGTKAQPFYPRSFEFIYDKPREELELKLARIGVDALPASCLPYGMAPDEHQTMVEAVNYTPSLAHRIVSLNEDMPLSSAIIKKSARGFALIQEVDTENKVVQVLLAEEPPIKFSLGILSEVEFLDDMPGRL